MGMVLSKCFALVTLVIFVFMTNVGVWSNYSHWLAHDLEHDANVVSNDPATNYVSLHDADVADDISATSSLTVEHELLHAANHLQFFLGINLKISFLPIATFIGVYSNFWAIPLATFVAPFRPPIFLSPPNLVIRPRF